MHSMTNTGENKMNMNDIKKELARLSFELSTAVNLETRISVEAGTQNVTKIDFVLNAHNYDNVILKDIEDIKKIGAKDFVRSEY